MLLKTNKKLVIEVAVTMGFFIFVFVALNFNPLAWIQQKTKQSFTAWTAPKIENISEQVDFFQTGTINGISSATSGDESTLLGGFSFRLSATTFYPKLARYKNGEITNISSSLVGFDGAAVEDIAWDGTSWMIVGGNTLKRKGAFPKINMYGENGFSDLSSLISQYQSLVAQTVESGTNNNWLIGLNGPIETAFTHEPPMGSTKNLVLGYDSNTNTISEIVSSINNVDLNGAYVTDIAWNGYYWLISYRSQRLSDPSPLRGPFKSRLLMYDGKTTSELNPPNATHYSVHSLGWNGKYWLVPVYRFDTDKSELYRLDNDKFTKLPVVLPESSVVSGIIWSGNYWILATTTRTNADEPIRTEQESAARIWKYDNVSLAEISLPRPLASIRSLAQVNAETILVGGIDATANAHLSVLSITQPPQFADGTLVKSPDRPEVYRIIERQRKHVPNPELFNIYGFKWGDIQMVDQNLVDAIQEIKLVQAPGDPKVYYIDNLQKRWLGNIEIFNSYGLGWENVFKVDAREINAYPTARLVKLTDDEMVYYVTGSGMKRHIPNPAVFESYGNKWQNIVTVTAEELMSYPANYLIKLGGTDKIYKVMLGKKHWVKNFGAFERLGFKLNDVAPVNQIEFNSYPEGNPIE